MEAEALPGATAEAPVAPALELAVEADPMGDAIDAEAPVADAHEAEPHEEDASDEDEDDSDDESEDDDESDEDEDEDDDSEGEDGEREQKIAQVGAATPWPRYPIARAPTAGTTRSRR